eukprot:3272097-Prymnesium_polylepis.2
MSAHRSGFDSGTLASGMSTGGSAPAVGAAAAASGTPPVDGGARRSANALGSRGAASGVNSRCCCEMSTTAITISAAVQLMMLRSPCVGRFGPR